MKLIILLFLVISPSVSTFGQNQFSVFFESNRYDLTTKEKSNLNYWMVANPKIKIVGIHGFCDEDGTNSFNDSLSRNRINYIYSCIKNKMNIREDFKTRSFGELHISSKIKAENRKVTLFFIEEKDLNRENEILGIKQKEIITLPKAKISYPEKMVFENPDGSKSEYKLDTIFMQKMHKALPGQKLKIENLNFQINTYIIVPQSKGKMYELLLVMKSSPNLKIEIQGHLCCMANDRLDLSSQRAKAVNNFLVGQGIDGDRITFKGFGSTQPIYPIPEKDETQRSANRRVEILIIDN